MKFLYIYLNVIHSFRIKIEVKYFLFLMFLKFLIILGFIFCPFLTEINFSPPFRNLEM